MHILALLLLAVLIGVEPDFRLRGPASDVGASVMLECGAGDDPSLPVPAMPRISTQRGIPQDCGAGPAGIAMGAAQLRLPLATAPPRAVAR